VCDEGCTVSGEAELFGSYEDGVKNSDATAGEIIDQSSNWQLHA
jgi:hypothetical protein